VDPDGPWARGPARTVRGCTIGRQMGCLPACRLEVKDASGVLLNGPAMTLGELHQKLEELFGREYWSVLDGLWAKAAGIEIPKRISLERRAAAAKQDAPRSDTEAVHLVNTPAADPETDGVPLPSP
jgi:hypothetical protein